MIARVLRTAALLVVLTSTRPGAGDLDVLRDIGFDQHLAAMLPLAARFTDEQGKSAPLAQFLDGRPAILLLGYYGCPNLCSAVRQSLSQGLAATGLVADAQFRVIAVSIDPDETMPSAAAARSSLFKGEGTSRAGAGWYFLTADADAIKELAQAVGFRYRYDRAEHQFVHPAGIVVVAPSGRVARYFFGVDFPPDQLRTSLLDAGRDRIASPVERLLLLCFHYDPETGKYSATVGTVSRALGVVTVLGLVAFIVRLRRQEGKARSPRR